MLAVDTNVVVRYVTNDDPAQSPIARGLIDAHEVWVSLTVLLEAEWVLRSAHKLDAERIHFIFTSFLGLRAVTPERPGELAQALDWFAHGMDFADALHLAAAMQNECDALATFDRKLAAAARTAEAAQVKLL